MTRTNMTHLKGGFYIVRTQAGFRQAYRQFVEVSENDVDPPPELYGFPIKYPSFVAFNTDYNGTVYVNAQCIHLDKLKAMIDENEMVNNGTYTQMCQDPAVQSQLNNISKTHDILRNWRQEAVNYQTTPELAIIPALKHALDAIHYYVDASDQELADDGLTRDQALDRARQLRAVVAVLA